MNYDLIVVGCGFCGSVIAHLAAVKQNKRVLILDKRNHIAGNMYDEYDRSGILIQKYGPHVFHTNLEEVYRFVTSVGDWFPYKLTYGVNIDGECIPAPFGFQAIDRLYDPPAAETLKRHLCDYYQDKKEIPILELLKNLDPIIKEFAELLYRKNYYPYALKQWNLSPDKLDKSVIGRMPVILSDREYYFPDRCEMLPEGGFTHFFKKLLDHPNITVCLNTRSSEVMSFSDDGIRFRGELTQIPVVYTGPLEEILSGHETSSLPYRSLYFEYQTFHQKSYQPTTLQTYPAPDVCIRTTEFRKLMKACDAADTIVAFEYPVPYDKNSDKGFEPYYPILTPENIRLNQQYRTELRKFKNLYPCGRLADYKYYNMDLVVKRALEVYDTLLEEVWA
jgi:UDP-galactopyranose mutase